MYRLSALVMCLGAHAALAVTADELATKNVEAKGGIDKLHAIQSMRLSGRIRVEHDTIELGYVTYVKQPGSIRYEASLQGLTQVQAYDGTQAWQINPFQGRKDPEKLSSDDAKGLGEDAADFTGPLVDYKSKGYKLDYLGTEDIDGTDAHKLRVTRPNGDISTVYLDPDHFLEIRTVNRRIEHGVPVDTVTDFGDYEQVAGVYLPFAQESGPKGSSDRQKVQFDKADANPTAPATLFQFPATAAHP
ncbi:MAG: LolA family protein [Steroidobacteraceae bacterium]